VIGQHTTDLVEVWRQLQFDALLLPPDLVPEDAVDEALRAAVTTTVLPRRRRSRSGLVERSDG
jgi:hypothetical protein